MSQQNNINRAVLGVVLATVLLLMVPFVAMQFTDQVSWKVGDFIIMGVLIFGTGISYVLVTRFTTQFLYRVAFGLALGTTLFMIWANLAVGLIGSGPNLGNLLYVGVVTIAIIGTFSSHFKATGMERAMYYTALSLVLLAIVALITKMDAYPGSSQTEIIGVNGFFAALYGISGLLFRSAGSTHTPQKANSY